MGQCDYYVYFVFDGILGRERFSTNQSGIDGYIHARDQFVDFAKEIGASYIEGARSAWDAVPIYHGPKVLRIGPA